MKLLLAVDSVDSAERVAGSGAASPAPGGMWVLLATDGSEHSRAAARSVSERPWPDGTEVRIVAVDDGVSPARIAHILPTAAEIIRSSNEEAAAKARRMAEWAAEGLRAIGLRVSVAIEKGEPQRILIEEAQKRDADSIFVGSRGLDHPDEGSGSGGVSTGPVTNATCTAEAVR